MFPKNVLNKLWASNRVAVSSFGSAAVFALALIVVALSGSDLAASAWQEAPPEETETQEPDKLKDYNKDQDDKKKEDGKSTDGKSTETDDKDSKAEPKSADGRPAEESGDAKSTPKKQETKPAVRTTRRRRSSRIMENSREATDFLQLFHPVISETAKATVQVKKGTKTIALGLIVDANGFVLTKHSELQTPLTCELSNGEVVAASVYGVHPATDLALLKIDAPDLNIVQWAQTDTLEVGHWLATVKDDVQPLTVGVVGVKARFIRPQSGFMGVTLRDSESGSMVIAVTPDSPAKFAGMKSGDVITKVNGEAFMARDTLIPKIKSFPPGEIVSLTLLRKKREIIVEVELGEERALNPDFERSNQQNTMGGNALSKRRQNFPMAVQHDSVLKPEECGGPVVNIDGEVVGVNIARQGRVSSLMLPASLVMPIVNELKTGQLAPAVVNKARIDEIARTIQNLTTVKNLSPLNEEGVLEKRVKTLNKEEKELREKLEQAIQERIRAEINLEQESGKFEDAKKEIERLERERETLVTGAGK